MTEFAAENFQKFIRPILFIDNENLDFPGGCGTLFLVSFRGRVFALTAFHVFKGMSIENVIKSLVITTQGSSKNLNISNCFFPEILHPDGEEIGDIAIIEISPESFSNLSGSNIVSALDIENLFIESAKVDDGSELYIFGYPHHDEKYDYSKKVITDIFLYTNRRFYFDKNLLHFADGKPSEIEFNGLSGSPVFLKESDEFKFMGICTRGINTSGTIRFIGSEIILELLKRIHIGDFHPLNN